MMSDRWSLSLAVFVLVAASVVAVGQEALIDCAPGAWTGEIGGVLTLSLTWGDGSLSCAVIVPGACEGFAGDGEEPLAVFNRSSAIARR